MELVIKAPGKYVQKAGILPQLGDYVRPLGKRVLVLCSDGSIKRMGQTIKDSLLAAGCEALFTSFGGDSTDAEILKISEICTAKGCNVVIGAGGGKVIDAARAAADITGVPLVIVPTVASNDAPCSALAVIHDATGAVTELRVTKRNPELVFVDTEVIAKAPERLLVAGMGDALATWFEACACKKSGAQTIAGGRPSEAALALARLCYETLIKCGRKAAADVREGIISDDLEQVVHANIYLSGIGFESGGVAAAHAINDGFSSVPESQHLYHGEIVGFGTLCMLMLESSTDEVVNEVAKFMKDVGLPMTFDQLGIVPTEELLKRVAEAACTISVMPNMPFEVTAVDVYNAMLKADALGKNI